MTTDTCILGTIGLSGQSKWQEKKTTGQRHFMKEGSNANGCVVLAGPRRNRLWPEILYCGIVSEITGILGFQISGLLRFPSLLITLILGSTIKIMM